MSNTRYLGQSREDHVVERAAHKMNSMLEGIHRVNPLPLGEKKVDDRTANKRLQQIPHDQLFDHYAKHG